MGRGDDGCRDPLGPLLPGRVVGRTEVVVCHWGSVGLSVEAESVNVPRHEGRWEDRDRLENIGVCDGLGNRSGKKRCRFAEQRTGAHLGDDRARARERQGDSHGGVLRGGDV